MRTPQELQTPGGLSENRSASRVGEPMLNPHLLLLLAPGAIVATECATSRLQPGRAAEAEARTRLGRATRLVVWLQKVREADIARTDPDVLVVDYSRDGGEDGERSLVEVERLRRRPDGSARIVLAYLSIGEAEDYRFYWKDLRGRRSLVGRPNWRWPGNYLVRYWDPAWHDVVYRGPRSYLDRILAQGFDGVFLDTVDAAEQWEDAGIADAPARMAALVRAIAEHARARRPDFLLVAQNPYCILGEPGVIEALSGVSSEAHLFPGGREVRPPVRHRLLETLGQVRERGRAVLVIEYPRSAAQRARFWDVCRKHGFACFAGTPRLDGPGFVPDPRGTGGRRP